MRATGKRGSSTKPGRSCGKRTRRPAVPSRRGEPRPLWTADDLKQGVVTTEPAPERFTKLPPPPLTLEPEPAPAPADAAPKSAEARNPTAEAALDVETPKSAGEPRAADTPKQAETTASVSNKPESISPHGEAAPPAEAAAVPGNSVEKADRYLKRGQYTIDRYLYEEAYQSGEILGALGMAKSYDASYLKSIGLQAKGDAPKARIWYRRAAEMSGKRRQGTP